MAVGPLDGEGPGGVIGVDLVRGVVAAVAGA